MLEPNAKNWDSLHDVRTRLWVIPLFSGLWSIIAPSSSFSCQLVQETEAKSIWASLFSSEFQVKLPPFLGWAFLAYWWCAAHSRMGSWPWQSVSKNRVPPSLFMGQIQPLSPSKWIMTSQAAPGTLPKPFQPDRNCELCQCPVRDIFETM